MDSKIQELTQKIFNEGVQKGNAEAERIIAEATAKRDTIMQEAKAQAESIIKEAEKKATVLQQNTQSELKLYADQMIESLKSAVTDKLTGDIVSNNVKAAMADPAFMQQIILEMVRSWNPDNGLEIKTSEAEKLNAYFVSNAKELLDKGVSINSVSGIPTSFQIGPKDGSYKMIFGEAEFIELFKSFLRPQLAKMLF
ncbi:hypothetical protein [Porphyromonas macacae]|uniref:V-type ATP synthase subunit E n=1 Tax=Porphyromonas macacae TaxID=28115 RepID=A0A379DIE7_9PORP|nr:hypothetical protein [Porphyromonas macacae]SUB77932.1 V-type ATP synthase subunit E [Porphyromonas macacae]